MLNARVGKTLLQSIGKIPQDHREHTILLRRKRVNKGMKRTISLCKNFFVYI